MVRSTVGSRWQVLYGTVRYLSRWPVLSPLLLMMRVIGQCDELSNASTVPYRTVRWRCLVTTVVRVLVTRILLCRIHSVIRIS